MRTAPKVALSLLLSLLLFAGLAVAAYAGLFNILETRFYQPAVIASMDKQLASVSVAMEEFHAENKLKFGKFVEADAVKRSLLPNQSAQDIFDRTNLAGSLMAEMPGLAGIRIIDASELAANPAEDKGTRRIHFSTFKSDILKKEDFLVSYLNYGRDDSVLPFAQISIDDTGSPKMVTDPERDFFVYCFPFHDAYGAWRGTAAFYVSGSAAVNALVAKGLARISDELALVSGDNGAITGVVGGMPVPGRGILSEAVVERWARKDFTVNRLVTAGDSGWVLVSRQAGEWGFVGQISKESLFAFPQSIRFLFLAISFFTIFLVVFLLFNLKPDGLVLVRHKIKRFQFQLLSELVENTDELKWEEIRKSIEYRRHDVNAALTKSFGRRLNKKYGKEIGELLDKSWDEILAAVGGRGEKQSITNADEIKLMLERVLQNNAISLNLTGVPVQGSQAPKAPARTKPTAAKPPQADNVEELEEVEPVEDLEEIESLEEVEETEPAEEIEEVESLEEVEEAEPTEEIEEVEALEEVEEAEPARLISQPEEIEEPALIVTAQPTTTLFTEIPFDVVEEEATEAEFVDADWEPEELGAPTEMELSDFIDEPKPDQVLVYNFDEQPSLDSTRRTAAKQEVILSDSFSVMGLDFSSLDGGHEQSAIKGNEEEDEATEVDYIDTFLLERIEPMKNKTDFGPVYEFLEVLGDTEPEELLDAGPESAEQKDSIVSRDGLYLVAPSVPQGKIDKDFKNLVDSIIL